MKRPVGTRLSEGKGFCSASPISFFLLAILIAIVLK